MGRTDVARLRESIGFVDARIGRQFAPLLTVRQVIRTGATATIGYFAERLSELDLDRADGLLGTFGLGPLGERRFGDCSQGERKRALIARALVARPRLLLLDEPGAGLDLPGRETLLASLDRLARDQPELAIVMTTHHLEELPATTTHALLLRDGRPVVAGLVAETLSPTSRMSALLRDPLGRRKTGAGRRRQVRRPRREPERRPAAHCRAARAERPPRRRARTPATRMTPKTPPGSASRKRTTPAPIGSAFVSSVATPAVASAAPR